MSEPDEMGLTIDAAQGYEAFFVPAIFHQWPEKIANAANLSNGAHILDAGCGTGVLTREVRGRGCTVTGIDLSSSMLSVARETCPDVSFEIGNVCELPFDDNSFDAALSAFMLMFVPQPENALAELSRVVRPGGRIALSVWQNLGNNPVYRSLVDATQEVAGDESAQAMGWPFTMGDAPALAKLFDQAGLTDVSVTAHAGDAQFPSVEALVNIEISAWLLAESISQTQIEQITRSLRQRYAPFTNNAGAIRFPLNALIAEATVA